ncbi:SMC family ATPase [Microbacterium sp. cx-55]|uniref:AAA family ATPase n=1 Tax=Microbacterium sp. cx-55 TaxID=2875948 RepID=UPI001CBBE46F|nr:SMC family ATPase [Microbacterium sp. cx-55]MBZ4487697.1 SMC family ATPase [Microbacterium sp. cx-55]UGB35708.1 SMC family ATPase [Microbacterium sp. cx-55]
MKLHRLELTGFGPFRDTQTVDFDRFDADGIFLISGRTGAGKSSVLDGVCFALYGNVPRYDGPDRRLRSDHCRPDDPTEVRLEFTVGGSRWRVIRAPEYSRPKLRGDGETRESARAELFELTDGGWVGRAGKPRDVAEVLDGVLGLNLQQFQQVILLAQNKFSRFLLAKNDERQALLRTLFGTRRYEDYARALDELRKTAQQLVRDRGVGAASLLTEAERLIAEQHLEGAEPAPAEDDLGARRQAAVTAVQRAEYRVEVRAQERTAAEAAAVVAAAEHARVSALRAAQTARDAAATQLAALEAEAADIDADRTRIERAVAAETLRASLDAVAQTAATQTAASDAVRVAADRWEAGGDDPDVDLVALDALDDQLTGGLARWQAAESAERDLVSAEATHTALVDRAATQEAALAALRGSRATVPAELASLDDELATARAAAGAAEALRAALAALAQRLEAARSAETLLPEVAAADAAYAAALDASAAAGSALTALLQRRLAGHAGELAAALVDGEPCAVCGATAHPHPAAPTDEPVTDDMIAAAERAREEAVAAERRAGDEAREHRSAHAALAARAGGEPVADLAAQLAEAEAQVAAATAAETQRDALQARRAALVEREAQAARDVESLAAELAVVREDAARAATTADALRGAVETARGAFASVAERVQQATARRERARALRAAIRAQATADAAAAAAASDLADRLAASPFPDAEAATAALLPAPTVQRLRDRVAEHDQQLAVVRARLLELQLELAGIPDERVDLAPAEAALAAADAARAESITALSVARTTAERLRDLVQRTDTAYAEIALLDEDAAVVARLADTLQGRAPNTRRMTLETFVLAAELEDIVGAANLRLADMSSGRYSLLHTDSLAARGAASGLGIEVMDAHTGQSRPPQSLSGGETFLASLSLALGLAEVVTNRAGGLRLDTLFIDEGFGSLDAETLEFAMRALDELRAGGRTVGVISHVEAMKEQLPAQLLVEATPQGPSVIRIPSGRAVTGRS